MSKEKAIFCWSGGKDSSLCLYEVLKANQYEVKYLLTTVNESVKRVSMHGVREELLERQAESIGLPLVKMYVSEGTNAEYEQNMGKLLLEAKADGINHVIFGDIFLEDLRQYRENNLAKVGMKAVFPLWKRDTRQLINEFIALDFETVICCVNDFYLGEDAVGKAISADFIKQLPANVDVCGENGEFHTFCHKGPIFKKEIKFSLGEKIYKPLLVKDNSVCSGSPTTKGFWYCDLVPE